MMKTLSALLTVMVLFVVGGLMMAGCESTSSTDSAISVTPSSAELSSSNNTQIFTASVASSNVALVLPLMWSVSDASLGTIKSSAGVTAIYESKGGEGNNTVMVHDQASAEGVAVARQR